MSQEPVSVAPPTIVSAATFSILLQIEIVKLEFHYKMPILSTES
jgi:hypothetical protein